MTHRLQSGFHLSLSRTPQHWLRYVNRFRLPKLWRQRGGYETVIPLIPDSVSAAPSSHQPGKPTRSKKTNAAGTSHRTWRAVDMMSVVSVVTVFDLTVVVAIVTVL